MRFCFTYVFFCLQQTGVQDYETFNEQLGSLGSWVTEAQEALKVQDPNGATDLTVIQTCMDKLKVFLVYFYDNCSLVKALSKLSFIYHLFCSGSC